LFGGGILIAVKDKKPADLILNGVRYFTVLLHRTYRINVRNTIKILVKGN
jgi:hypothetical protein